MDDFPNFLFGGICDRSLKDTNHMVSETWVETAIFGVEAFIAAACQEVKQEEEEIKELDAWCGCKMRMFQCKFK